MFRSDPLAYFLTWTCYGTWLHGDPRGSVDDEHNIYATPQLLPDPRVWYGNIPSSSIRL